MDKIDIVILWVDGDDPAWKSEKNKYANIDSKTDDDKIMRSEKCFRDWGLLRYWFRGIESNAPWVNKVHFVTWGHLPKWLNVEYEKLHIVNHEDFMPSESLPTFNSRALEVNLHRIQGLSEKFVYFNDDMYLLKPVKESDFFLKGLPRDNMILSPVIPERYGTGAIQVNNMEIINHYINKSNILKNSIWKLLNIGYGKELLRTLPLLMWRKIPGFFEPHTPYSFLKQSFDELWRLEPEVFNKTTMSKFKEKSNVNQWIFRYWQLAQGRFQPRKVKFSKFYTLSTNNTMIYSVIRQRDHHIICINDSNDIANDNIVKKELIKSFDSILPNKSKYEK